MQARVKAGWITEADLAPPAGAEEPPDGGRPRPSSRPERTLMDARRMRTAWRDDAHD